MPTFGSLFAGIGGIDLGLERAGWTGRWQVEWDPYCQHVLAHHWPDIPRWGDITQVDWSTVEPVDLIAGGFPCQPFSVAGKRRGKDDDRWLWPEFARAIRALRPRYVLVENVPGLLAGHGGMGAVLGDLAELGYDAEWDSIPAAAVGAPHLRYRVWIVATDTNGGRDGGLPADAGDGGSLLAEGIERFVRGGDGSEGVVPAARDVANADGHGQGRPATVGQASSCWTGASEAGAEPDGAGHGASGVGDPDCPPTDPYATFRRPRGAASEPGWWESEPDVGRVAHGVPARVDRLRALGNAVVPQVVEAIGRRLMDQAR